MVVSLQLFALVRKNKIKTWPSHSTALKILENLNSESHFLRKTFFWKSGLTISLQFQMGLDIFKLLKCVLGARLKASTWNYL